MRLAASIVVVLSLAYLAVFIVCAALRLDFPWDLEWMEGGMITHAARVLQGKPIYAPPSVDFVSFFYTPLYPALLAGLSYLTSGLSFTLARGVSLVATLLTFGMLFYAGKREGGLYTGLLAMGLYAALYRMCGTFYDLARVDALALSVSLAGCLVAYYVPTRRGAAGAAAIFVVAFFAKQTAPVVAPAVAIYLLTVDIRRAAIFGSVGIVLGFLAGALLDHQTAGWFTFYTVSGHQGHLFYIENFALKYWRDVLFLAPFLLLLPALGASYGRRSRWVVLAFLALFAVAFVQRVRTLDYEPHMYYRELWYERTRILLIVPPLALATLLGVARSLQRSASPPPLLFLLLYGAGALASALNHSTQWAYSNCFMPVALFGSLYAALTVHELLKPALATSNEVASSPARRAQGAFFALSAALLIQLVALGYKPLRQVPSAADRAALSTMMTTLDSYPGPVFMPAHPMYSYLRDGTVHVHQMGIGDVAFAGGVDDLAARLERGDFPTVVEERCCELEELELHYERVHEFKKRHRLYPKTGFRTRPRAVWLRRSLAGSP